MDSTPLHSPSSTPEAAPLGVELRFHSTAPSPILHYGPGSEPAARAAAALYGRVLKSDGPAQLRKGDARLVVETLNRTTVGAREALVVGPVDELTPITSDVFLKTLEERPPHAPQPFLWAWDLGGVAPTLRSRCLTYWAPGADARCEPYEATARQLLSGWHKRDWVAVIEELKELREDLELLLRAVVERLAAGAVSGAARPAAELELELELWVRLRPLMSGSPLTPARVITALVAARSSHD